MIKVYKYGLLPPIENADVVQAQMRAAHELRKKLVEIEREKRNKVRALEPAIKRAVDAVKLELEELLPRVKKAEERKDPQLSDMKVRLREVRSRLKVLEDEWKTTRSAPGWKEMVQAEKAAASDAAKVAAVGARTEVRLGAGLFCGTYRLVEAAAEASFKTPFWDGVEPNDPSFPRWDGDGTLGVQIQNHGGPNGFDSRMLFGGDDRHVTVDPVDDRAWSSSRSDRRKYSKTVLRMKVVGGKEPVWAAWPMIMHRPIPEGSIVTGVSVHRTHHGPHVSWYATFTVREPHMERKDHGRGAVALDLGWRKVDGGVRVGMLCNDADLGAEQVLVPASDLDGMERVWSLESTRTKNFNEALAQLVASIAQMESMPDWFAQATATLAQWKSENRLARLALRWRKNRFDGDCEAYEALEKWRYHDHHLWAWEAGQRRGYIGRRNDCYRVLASRLAKQYHTLILEDLDLRPLALRNSTKNDASRRHRQAVAPSALRLALINAFLSRGGQVIKLPCEDTTRECHVCGHVQKWDQAARIFHRCYKCDALWDQDINAARNLLERWRSAPDPGVARIEKESEKFEGKWQKRKRIKVEKRAESQVNEARSQDSSQAFEAAED